jgi:hypothetical protein
MEVLDYLKQYLSAVHPNKNFSVAETDGCIRLGSTGG